MEDPTNENGLDNDDEMDGPVESPDHEDILDSTGRILEQQPAFDKIINAEVMIQNGDEMAMGKVTQRSLDGDGRTTGTYHDNPFLNTITYDIEFPMDRSRNMAPTSFWRTCSPKLTQMDIAYP